MEATILNAAVLGWTPDWATEILQKNLWWKFDFLYNVKEKRIKRVSVKSFSHLG